MFVGFRNEYLERSKVATVEFLHYALFLGRVYQIQQGMVDGRDDVITQQK
jgi:hypothetical protein